MIIRSVDNDHDWNFGKGLQSYFKDEKAIAMNIETRLLSFVNDCFFDQEAGVDWIRLLGAKSTREEIILSCRAVILQSFGVVRINELDASALSIRNLTLTYNIDTIYSSQFENTVEVLNG